MSSTDIGDEPSAGVPVVGAGDGRFEDGSGTEGPAREIYERVSEPTAASTWAAVSGGPITDRLLEWPADVFALTDVVLERAEVFRYALSPLREGLLGRRRDWAEAVEEAGRRWSVWAEAPTLPIPEFVAAEWSVLRERAETPLERLAAGGDPRLCGALLTLHAIADEACAGLGVALDTSDADACVYRARGRELLVRTGSLGRISPRFLRVLPKVSTPPTGPTKPESRGPASRSRRDRLCCGAALPSEYDGCALTTPR